MLKKFHYFFNKDFEKIYEGQIKIHKTGNKWDKYEILKYLFSIDEDLKKTYLLKERYRKFNLTADYENCNEEFNELIDEFLNSKHEDFRIFGSL